jgi:hypothetical protein
MTRLSTYNNGQQTTSTLTAAGATFGAVSSAIGTAKRLSTAINTGYETGNIAGAIRSINLPAAGEAIGDIASAVSMFTDNGDPNDWRVRLSLPNWMSFKNSPVLAPLSQAGGLIFPYTPTINIKSNANYASETVTHSNYPFQVYKNSAPGTITINAPMNVEDSTQALYWIAAVHYLRSVTKMFSGYDPKAGNPPPIVYLNGYGNYVFKNVPVVITAFETTLGNDCDYIHCDVVGSAAGNISGIADSIGGIAGTIGGAIPSLAGITGSLSNIAGTTSELAALLGSYNIGGTTSGGQAYVPTKSSFSVTLQPVYSRNSARNFSLDRFVSGGYLNNYFGYL